MPSFYFDLFFLLAVLDGQAGPLNGALGFLAMVCPKGSFWDMGHFVTPPNHPLYPPPV